MPAASYLGVFFKVHGRKEAYAKVIKVIEDRIKATGQPKESFHLVGRGISGTLAAGILATKMDMNLCIVRKEPSPHSSSYLESTERIENYLIVDDFICTGYTVEVMVNTISQSYKEAKCQGFIGIYDYAEKCDAVLQLHRVKGCCPFVGYASAQADLTDLT